MIKTWISNCIFKQEYKCFIATSFSRLYLVTFPFFWTISSIHWLFKRIEITSSSILHSKLFTPSRTLINRITYGICCLIFISVFNNCLLLLTLSSFLNWHLISFFISSITSKHRIHWPFSKATSISLLPHFTLEAWRNYFLDSIFHQQIWLIFICSLFCLKILILFFFVLRCHYWIFFRKTKI